MSGGGGGTSSNAGGLKDGVRRRCMGRSWPALGSWTWAAGGRVSPAVGGSLMLEEELLTVVSRRRLLIVGRREDGEFRRRGAPGHPHDECSVRRVVDSGEE